MITGVEIGPLNSVQEIVKRDYRTADIFHRHGIKYCCGARFPLVEVCENQGLDFEKITRELEFATQVHRTVFIY